MTAVDLSVVIVNHNHRSVIEKCFESLYSLPDHASFETILIDNTCRDGADSDANRLCRLCGGEDHAAPGRDETPDEQGHRSEHQAEPDRHDAL